MRLRLISDLFSYFKNRQVGFDEKFFRLFHSSVLNDAGVVFFQVFFYISGYVFLRHMKMIGQILKSYVLEMIIDISFYKINFDIR